MPHPAALLLAAWRSPWTCAVAALLLALNALAMGLVARHATDVGSFARRHVWREPRPYRDEHVVTLFLIRQEAGGYSLIAEQESVGGPLALAAQQTPERVISVSYWAGRWRTGFWSPTRSRTLSRVEAFSLATGATPLADADQAAARGAVIAWLESHARADDARSVLAGDVNTSEPVWWGRLNDATVALLAGGFLATLARLPWTIRERTVRGRLARGRCPRCRYDLSGLEGPTRRCPECGRTWDMRRLRPGAPDSAAG